MFVEFDVDRVARRTGIFRPHVLLHEAHTVEHLLGLAGPAIGQFLGVPELAADALDRARLAADVVGRADMARRITAPDIHVRTDGEARRHGLPTFGPSGRFSMSANLVRSSSMLIVPR